MKFKLIIDYDELSALLDCAKKIIKFSLNFHQLFTNKVSPFVLIKIIEILEWDLKISNVAQTRQLVAIYSPTNQ